MIWPHWLQDCVCISLRTGILTDSDLFYPINGHEGALDSRKLWVGACRYDPHGPALAFTRPV